MIEIRNANYKDIDKILSITKSAFLLYKNELHTDTKLSALCENYDDVKNDIDNNFVFIAEDDNNIVGVLRMQLLNDKLSYLYRFSVEPKGQNSGVGTMLIEHAINKSKLLGMSAIALHTNTKYYQLCRYYYGKEFYVHSTDSSRGYIRGLFIKDLKDEEVDLSGAFEL